MSVDRIISAESGGNAYAKNPRSSATGAGQFIDSTWLNTIGKYRPDLVQGLDRNQILALRNDPALSKEMTAAYSKENQGILGAAGVPVNDGTAYLAHFAGPQGAIKVLQADPNAPVGGILGDKVVAANPFLANMTAADLIGWAGKKMGVDAPAPQPAPAAPQPMGVLPQPAAPQAAPSAPSALGNFTPQQAAPQGVLGNPQTQAAQTQAPPDFEDLASLIQPNFRPLRRGLSFRA